MGSTVPLLHLPVGFRFRPTDEELVNHYLNKKLQGHDSSVNIIPVLDLCKVEPWQVPDYSIIKSDDQEWFFFSAPNYKYSKSKRFNRTTKCGFWKATGNDRNIKIKGNNKVIGTKKTLVFYEGRVSNGVKSDWVIHEYHAATFDESQRTFVLCRLMNKASKKGEDETDAVTFDEGEPSASGHMASDFENHSIEEEFPDLGVLPEMNVDSIFRAPVESEGYLPSTEHSPICIEQEASLSNSAFSGAYFRNDHSLMQSPVETTGNDNNILQSPFKTNGNDNSILPSPFETIEEEDEFVTSMLADNDFGINEEIRNAFFNCSTQSESLRRVCYESSEAEAEVNSALFANSLDTSTLYGEHPSSGEYNASEMLKSSQDAAAIQGLMGLLSTNHEAEREKKESIFQDDFCGVGTSSCDSTADMPLEINCLEISSPPSTLRRWKNQHRARSSNFISQRNAVRRTQKQRKVSSNAASQLEAEKELTIMESKKDKRSVQNTNACEYLETRSHQSSDVNRKGSFIFLETPSSSQSLFPRSVYLVNVVIGIFLFIVTILEVLSC